MTALAFDQTTNAFVDSICLSTTDFNSILQRWIDNRSLPWSINQAVDAILSTQWQEIGGESKRDLWFESELAVLLCTKQSNKWTLLNVY
jgi:hypothetical protein